MKKILWIVIPLCLAALLLGAHSAMSFGGHHMGGSMDDMMMFHLQSMAKDLNLTPDQQAKLDSMKQDAESRMQQGWAKHKQLHDAIQQQLSSGGNFDFAQIRTMLDAQIDDRAAAAHNAVAGYQQFFDQLTPDQKKAMSDQLRKKMQEMQQNMQMWQQHSQNQSNQQQQQ